MDQTSSITGALNVIVQEISKEAQAKLEQIQQKFQQHEKDFKKKICQQVEAIKSVLQELDNGTGGKIKDLKPTITKLVGNSEGVTNSGKLRKLLDGIGKISQMRKLGWNDVFKSGERIRDADEVISAVRNIRFQKSYYPIYVKGATSHLREIIKVLNQINIQNVNSEIKSYNGDRIDEYKDKINEHQVEMWRLQMMDGPRKIYEWYLRKMYYPIRHLNSLKIPENEDKLTEGIQNIVKEMEDIKYRELKQIDREIGEIIDKAKKAYRDLENTHKMFEYLTCIKAKNKEITKLSINRTTLKQIESTISGVQNAYQGIQQAKEEIRKAKEELKKNLEEDSTQGRTGQSNEEKEKMLPEELKLDEKGELKDLEEKLNAIKEFKDTLPGITSGMNSLKRNSQQSNGSGVDIVLKWLGEIDVILSTVYSSTNSAVTKMKESYDTNKEKINGTDPQNGPSIQSHVLSIGQIPNKIAQLQSKVKYYIVLLNIAKSVNETLDGVEDDAVKLKGITETMNQMKSCIERIKKEYESISEIARIFACCDDIITLKSLKADIGQWTWSITTIHKHMRTIKFNCKLISRIISEIINYKKILFQISEEIVLGFSKVGINHFGMPLVLIPSPVYGSILHGFHGLWLPFISRHLLLLSVQVGIIMAHLSLIRMKLERIVSSDLIQSIEVKVNEVNCSILEVESSIESVIVCFLKCSNNSITNNKIKSSKRFLTRGGQEYNNEVAKSGIDAQYATKQDGKNENVWTLLSNAAIVETKFVASKLYECHTKNKEILEDLKTIYCECAVHIGCRNKPNCIKELPSYGNITENFNESKERNVANDDQNNICICLVIRYVMYPSLMQCASYIANMDFDLLSIMDRKFDKHTKWSKLKLKLPKLASFFVEIVGRIWIVIKKKYSSGFIVYSDRVIHCFCRSPDSEYSYFITTMIYISFLVENMFINQNETTRDSIQSLSALEAELEHDKVNITPVLKHTLRLSNLLLFHNILIYRFINLINVIYYI